MELKLFFLFKKKLKPKVNQLLIANFNQGYLKLKLVFIIEIDFFFFEKLNFKLDSWFWKVSIDINEIKTHQISIFGFQCVTLNIEGSFILHILFIQVRFC